MSDFTSTRSVSFVIDGTVDTRITVTEITLADGTTALKFDLEVLDEGGSIGDMRALFFDLQGSTPVSADSLAAVEYEGGLASYDYGVTDVASEEEAISTLGKDANIKGDVVNELGKFDVGVEIGTSGASADDIQETSFVLQSTTGENLTLEMVDFTDFGIRYTSVGQRGGDRSGSEKTGGLSNGVAQSDSLDVQENSSASRDLLANDSLDADGDGIVTSGEAATIKSVFLDTSGGIQGDLILSGGAYSGAVLDDGQQIGTLTLTEAGALSFDANGAGADALTQGETRQISGSYTSVVTDPAGYESLATAQFTITVTGVNDAPEITGDSVVAGTVDEDGEDAPTIASGQLVVSDPDQGADHDWQVLGLAMGTYGMLTVSATGEWTYTLAYDSLPVQSLTQADSVEEVFYIEVTDEFGATDVQQVTITVTGSDDGPDIDNTFEGTVYGDDFYGYPGNTVADGLGGNDFLVGDYAYLHNYRTIYVDGVAVRGWRIENQDTHEDISSLNYIELVNYTAEFGNDVIDAGPGQDRVIGDAAYMYLRAVEEDMSMTTGDDVLVGSTESDRLYGEGIQFNLHATDGNTFTLVAGNDQIQGDSGADTIYGEVDYLLVYPYQNSVTSNAFTNEVLVTCGADTISGGADNDTIYGEARALMAQAYDYQGQVGSTLRAIVVSGADSIAGDAGNDSIYGDGELLNASYGDQYSSGATAVVSVIGGGDQIEGGSGIDVIHGDGWRGYAFDYAVNVSGPNHEVITVTGGADVISGGADGDTIYGDFNRAYANSYYDTDGTYRVTGGDDQIDGDGGNDWIYGDFYYVSATRLAASAVCEVVAGDDTINGGAGNDNLWGDARSLNLNGGDYITGADTFVFETGSGFDTIRDFEAGKDVIDVSGYGFTGFGQLSITESGANSTIDLDGTADTVAQVLVVDTLGLTADDFIFAIV